MFFFISFSYLTFEENKIIIALNRAKFENLVNNESDEEALERIEKEIELQYVMIQTEEACERFNANERLLDDERPEDDENNDEQLEDEHGYHSLIQAPTIRATMLNTDVNQGLITSNIDDLEYMKLITQLKVFEIFSNLFKFCFT